MNRPLEMQRERITSGTARDWRGRILGLLTKRDQDDLTRISVKIGGAAMIRYYAAQYLDPMFAGGAEDAAFRAFGEKVEAAYQEMLSALRAAQAAKFEVQHRGKGWCVVNGHEVRRGPYGSEDAANDALVEVRADIMAGT